MSQSIALFIWRFQPWHIGHRDALDEILNTHSHVKIVIWSSQESRTSMNPWTAEEREEIIRQDLNSEFRVQSSEWNDSSILNFEFWTLNSSKRIWFYYLPDILESDELWLRELQKVAWSFDMLFSGNDWMRNICEEFGVPFAWIDYNIDISATQIREMISNWKDVSKYTSQTNLPF